MDNTAQKLAAFAADLNYDDLPPETIERAKLLILDLAGIIVRARHDADSTPSMMKAMNRLGLDKGECSVLGDAAGYAPPAAAMVNGTLAHSLDFDDTHAEASLHSSAPIVPAVLAAAEMTGASGKDVIAAVVAGYEIQIRLSLALVPSEHYDRGFHPTATCGVFAAAAAAGKLFGLDADGIVSAFGIALSQSAGSMQFLADGSWTKRSHVGQAAQNGLMCAAMAADGFKGPDQPFEGKWGLFNSHAPNPVWDTASAELGERWETLRLAVKPYPACRYTHAPMDAILALKEEHGIDPDDVESIEVGIAETGWKIIGNPLENKQEPETVVDGQFSMPFCAAVAMRSGPLRWDDYKTLLQDAGIRDLCRRVEVKVDPRAEAEFPVNMSGVATIRTKSGGTYEKFVMEPLGEPGNFMSEQQFRAKFDDLAVPYLAEDGANRLADAILSLEEANSVRSIMALGRPV